MNVNDESFDDLLNQIKTTISDSYAINVWFPSLESTGSANVLFKPLNISQQKDLLKTSIQSDIFNTQFIKEAYNIIATNCLCKTIKTDNLTILDKLFILLYLKANVSEKITHINDKNISFDINLQDLINNLQKSCKKNTSVYAPLLIEERDIKITCSIPSIIAEYQCEIDRPSSKENNEIEKQIQNIISETIVNEITKFCSSIEIKSKEILLSSFTFNERKKIIESIPVFIIDKILEYIVNYKKFIENALTISNNDLTVTEILQIDGVFFSTV